LVDIDVNTTTIFQMIVGFVDIGGIVDRSLSFHNSKCK
jgi:hypothetical protein